MGFTDLFAFGKKKNKNVDVKEIKKESVDMGATAAGSPSEAAGALARLMDQKNAPTKILMLQDGDYMPEVTEYAMKMAQKLSCDIIALDVTEKPLQFSGERKTRETDRFMDMAQTNAEHFTAQAKAQGIKVEHMVKIGNPEEVVASVSAADAGIRYVLSKPEDAQANQEHPHVPVYDLHCSRLNA